MDEETYTFQEAYGDMPVPLWKTIKKHNVSPADYMMLQLSMNEDWDRLDTFIKMHSKSGSFVYPFGVNV